MFIIIASSGQKMVEIYSVNWRQIITCKSHGMIYHIYNVVYVKWCPKCITTDWGEWSGFAISRSVKSCIMNIPFLNRKLNDWWQALSNGRNFETINIWLSTHTFWRNFPDISLKEKSVGDVTNGLSLPCVDGRESIRGNSQYCCWLSQLLKNKLLVFHPHQSNRKLLLNISIKLFSKSSIKIETSV